MRKYCNTKEIKKTDHLIPINQLYEYSKTRSFLQVTPH